MSAMTPYQADIMDLLRERAGDYLSPYAICRAIGRPLAATRIELGTLAHAGEIKSTGRTSNPTYFIPSAEQLAAEQKLLAARHYQVLRPRLEHRARIEQIRAARAATPSLFAMKGGSQ